MLAHLESLTLNYLGDEMQEHRQLKKKFGWQSVTEAGKAYDKAGTIDWYFFVYSSGEARPNELDNPLANLLCYTSIKGPVVVLKSGPTIPGQKMEYELNP